jgi:hypothetical protein
LNEPTEVFESQTLRPSFAVIPKKLRLPVASQSLTAIAVDEKIDKASADKMNLIEFAKFIATSRELPVMSTNPHISDDYFGFCIFKFQRLSVYFVNYKFKYYFLVLFFIIKLLNT